MVAIDVQDAASAFRWRARSHLRAFLSGQPHASQRLGGSGVGLALAKRFAEGLGGALVLLESAEGVGSTFRFTIPLGLPARGRGRPSVGELTPVLPLRVRPLEGLRVLVADDEELVRDALCKLLEAAGATVGRAADGEEATAKALAEDFALILMDIRMPVLDGLAATSRLRAAGFRRPIVALTANAASIARRRASRPVATTT